MTKMARAGNITCEPETLVSVFPLLFMTRFLLWPFTDIEWNQIGDDGGDNNIPGLRRLGTIETKIGCWQVN